MKVSEAHPPAAKGLFSTLKDDWRAISDDVARRRVGPSVHGALAGIEAFYLTTRDREQLATMGRFKRTVVRLWWLLKSLLLKLTPARRVLLIFGIWFLLAGPGAINVSNGKLSIHTPWLGAATLLTLLMLELKDKLTARDELEAGRQVQLALMPESNPAIPGWDVWLYTRPANDVGGDLVDHLQLDEHRHVVALGDVAGKALPAALLSVKLQATLRALAPQFENLGELGASVNRILFRDGLPTRFASLVHLVLTAGSGRVRLLNAGHMPPLVMRDGAVVATDRGSMVLGIMPDATFSEQIIELGDGETLIVYSDGVTEAMNEAGDFFGDDRLFDAILRGRGLASAALGAEVLDAVRNFVGEAVPNDDLSLLVLKRHAAAG